MEQRDKTATLIGKLSGLDFYVYLYRLDAPRAYPGHFNSNTIGLGYVGREHSPDIQTGLDRLCRGVGWLREQIPALQEKHGRNFPDAAQYEVFNYLDKEFSLLVSGETMRAIEGRAWIEHHLLGREGSIEERIGQLRNTPVRIEYRRIK